MHILIVRRKDDIIQIEKTIFYSIFTGETIHQFLVQKYINKKDKLIVVENLTKASVFYHKLNLILSNPKKETEIKAKEFVLLS